MDLLENIVRLMFHNITFLKGVWLGSMALGIISVLAMLGLVVHRIVVHHREAALDVRRKALRMRVLAYLENDTDAPSVKDTFTPDDRDLLRDIVINFLGSVRGDLRDRLIVLLRDVGVREAALRELKDGSQLERLRAVEVVALFPDDEVIAVLHDALDDEEPQVRLYAAKALSEFDPEFKIRELIEKLDIGGAIRSRMLRDIFRQVGQRDTKDLVRILKADFSDAVTVLALYAIGAAQDYTVVSAVAAKLESPSVNVRAEAMRALTAIGHPAAEPLVLKAFTDDAWAVRTQAAVCAGRIGFASAIPHLQRQLGDDEWWARYRAGEALAKLGDAGVRMLEQESQGKGRAAQIAGLVLAEREQAA